MTAQILYCHPPQNQPPTKHSADDTDSHLSLKTKPINLCSELCSSGHHQTFLLICEFNFGVKGSKLYTNDNSSHTNIARTNAKFKVVYTCLYKSLYILRIYKSKFSMIILLVKYMLRKFLVAFVCKI